MARSKFRRSGAVLDNIVVARPCSLDGGDRIGTGTFPFNALLASPRSLAAATAAKESELYILPR
jgi:hypothetical protein